MTIPWLKWRYHAQKAKVAWWRRRTHTSIRLSRYAAGKKWPIKSWYTSYHASVLSMLSNLVLWLGTESELIFCSVKPTINFRVFIVWWFRTFEVLQVSQHFLPNIFYETKQEMELTENHYYSFTPADSSASLVWTVSKMWLVFWCYQLTNWHQA